MKKDKALGDAQAIERRELIDEVRDATIRETNAKSGYPIRDRVECQRSGECRDYGVKCDTCSHNAKVKKSFYQLDK